MRPALVVAALLLAGCARLPTAPVTDGLTAEARTSRLRSIETWQMRGRLAVETDDGAHQARFFWRQTPDALSLTVRGPLGAGSFQISGSDERLTILARGEENVLTDPERDLSAMFGWWMPVTSLRSWLLGLPDPRFPLEGEFQIDGVPGIDQRLWRIRYSEYQLIGGLMIPRSSSLEHETVAVELTIDDWSHEIGPVNLN